MSSGDFVSDTDMWIQFSVGRGHVSSEWRMIHMDMDAWAQIKTDITVYNDVIVFLGVDGKDKRRFERFDKAPAS
jgi:hypothetical protein